MQPQQRSKFLPLEPHPKEALQSLSSSQHTVDKNATDAALIIDAMAAIQFFASKAVR